MARYKWRVGNTHQALEQAVNQREFERIDIREFGADTRGVNETKTTDAFAAAIREVSGANDRIIVLPGGTFAVAETQQIDARSIQFEGQGEGRPTQQGGARINFTGTGPLFRMGHSKISDTNLHDASYTAGDYDGVEGFTLRNLSIAYAGGASTPLLSGYNGNTYGTGTFGIQDWRGGSVVLDRVWSEHFQYGFWGIQSDFNTFTDCRFLYHSTAIYAGPRTDQMTLERCYTLANDTALWLDGCQGFRAHDTSFVDDGSATTAPLIVGSSYPGQYCDQPVLRDCWAEHYAGFSTTALPVFCAVGVSPNNQTPVRDPLFDNLTISAGFFASPPSINRLFQVGDVDGMEVNHVGGMLDRVNTLIDYVGSTNPTVRWAQKGSTNIQSRWTNSGTGAPHLTSVEWVDGQLMVSGVPGRLWVRQSPNDASKDFYLSAENQNDTFNVVFPNDGTGNTTRLNFSRRVHSQGGIPVAGTWAVGDLSINTGPAAGQPAMYVCTAAGTPGTWLPTARAFATGAAIPDTSGATLAALETEVNKVKAALRSAGVIA